MYKVGPLEKGYWEVEFTTNGMVVTKLSNTPPLNNNWIRLWCDGCYLEGSDWSDLKILVKDPNENDFPSFTLEDYYTCECGADSVGSDKHSNYCPLWENDL